MEHLTCFIAGNLALGVMHGAIADPKKVSAVFLERKKKLGRKKSLAKTKTHSSLSSLFFPTPIQNNKKKSERYLDAAKGITETCYNMYKLMPSGKEMDFFFFLFFQFFFFVQQTSSSSSSSYFSHLFFPPSLSFLSPNSKKLKNPGLAPEYVRFDTAPAGPPGSNPPSMVSADNAPYNLLRPETVESLFMLWRATGDRRYREWGWELFQSFERHCKVTGGGYSGIVDVREAIPRKNDKQESFWLAETLKYFYLLFSPESALPLDVYVLNTEAHPLKVLTPADVGALTSDFGSSPAGLGQYVSGVRGGGEGGNGGGSGGRDTLLADVAAKLASSSSAAAKSVA